MGICFMGILQRLLDFAEVEEDPATEVLAWFLRESPPLRTALLVRFNEVMIGNGASLPWTPAVAFGEPTVSTQVVVADPRGGSCRYDLVIDWHEPRVRLIIEVKVWAGLTWKLETDPNTAEKLPADQVNRYIRLARDFPEVRTHVITLAPYMVEFDTLPPAPAFAGHVSWQVVRDIFERVVRSDALDTTMRLLATDFVSVMEVRHMAAPKLTFDALTSVYRYRRFQESITTILTHARDALVAEGSFAEFEKGSSRNWQDAHNRLGWRLPLSSDSSGNHFAFIGLYVGPDTLHEEVPDLYFFLELQNGSAAQKMLDGHQEDLARQVSSLSTDTTRWYFYPGGSEAIGACRSLVEAARTQDPTDATTNYFRDCIKNLQECGLLALFLNAAKV